MGQKVNLLKYPHIYKDLCRYGRNTQICKLQGRGYSKLTNLEWGWLLKTTIALLKPNILLIFFVKILSYAYKI